MLFAACHIEIYLEAQHLHENEAKVQGSLS